jgi:two-component system CheB/CheR fusion protein
MSKAASKRPASSTVADPRRISRRSRARGFPIVGIGASAGGLEAVTKLLQHLPADLGMGLVLVQHLDPTHESALATLLARATTMPVIEARNRLRVRPGHVYIIPPNKKIGISGGVLRLLPREERGDPHAPVDYFFRELAADQGSRAIGVVLSGTGQDGTEGIRAIKAADGITLVQDDQSARYAGMPASAGATGCADFVLPPEAMAAELVRLRDRPGRSATDAEGDKELVPADGDDFQQICALVRAHSGVDFAPYKPTTIRRRISRRMALQKLDRQKDYVEFLRKNPAEVEALFQDILICVTGFFRDPKTFEALKKKVFPQLLKSQPADGPIRLWSAGCSTGEEAYSLAIVLLEVMDKEGSHRPIQIFGSDVNEKILARARAGIYPETIKEDVSPERLRRFFTRTTNGYRIAKAIRDLCIFARQDLTRDPPFSNIDLISCRNVLIYFDASLQKKVVPIFHYALKPNGFLVLGTAESIGGFADLFSVVDARHRLYVRKVSSARMTRMPALFAGGERTPLLARPATLRPGAEPMLAEVRRQADAIVVSQLAPTGVVVNSSLEILQFRGHTGRFLENTPGDASLNLLKMARQGLAVELRPLLSRAAKLKHAAVKEGVQVRQDGRVLTISLKAIPFLVPPGTEQFFLVVFDEKSSQTLPVSKKDRGGRLSPVQRELEQLRDELSASKLALQTIIEEQDATNEELRAASEEALSSNEELQSTNEELETAKEELQSSNEELTTLNEELQNRNSELQQVSDDLVNLFSSVDIPIIMLSADLRIRRFTPKAQKVLNLIPGDVGRPITDLKFNLTLHDLPAVIADVLDSLATRERDVQDLDGRWHTLRIRPYKTTDNRIDGVVLTLLDIDTIKRSLAEAQEARQFAEAVIATVREPLLVLDADLRVRMVNRSYYEFFKTKPEDTERHYVYDLGNGQWNLPALRELLEEVLPKRSSFENFRVEHDFSRIGKKSMLLNARRLAGTDNRTQAILLALEDVTNAG